VAATRAREPPVAAPERICETRPREKRPTLKGGPRQGLAHAGHDGKGRHLALPRPDVPGKTQDLAFARTNVGEFSRDTRPPKTQVPPAARGTAQQEMLLSRLRHARATQVPLCVLVRGEPV
jgi:hypothetical protein